MQSYRSRSKERISSVDQYGSHLKRSNSLVSHRRNFFIENILPKSKSEGPGLTGIKNHGNTCYLNSVIQCLNNCSQFAEFLLEVWSENTNKNILTSALSELILNFWKSHYSSKLSFQFFLTSSKLMPQFNTSQSDAHEYLHFLLDKLNEESYQMNRNLKDIFNGKYSTMIKCNSCNFETEVNSDEISLCLSIPEYIEIQFIINNLEKQVIEKFLIIEISTPMNIIKNKIHKQTKLFFNSIVMICIQNGLIHIYEDNELLSPIESIYVFEMDYIISDSIEYINLILYFISNMYTNYFRISTVVIKRESTFEELIYKIVTEDNGCINNEDNIYIYNPKTSEYFKLNEIDMPLYDTAVEKSVFRLNSQNHLVLVFAKKKHLYNCKMIKSTKQIKSDVYETDIIHCIDSYIHEELDTSMNWVCDNCKKQSGASIRLSIDKLPDILIFHLKRFKQFNDSIIKVETSVQFPLRNLSMKNYINKSSKKSYVYDLVAVCNHYGTLENGHYTACCRNAITNSWHLFDDEKVSRINEGDVISSSAYILFYERRDESIEKSRNYIKNLVSNTNNINSNSHSSTVSAISIIAHNKPPKKKKVPTATLR